MMINRSQDQNMERIQVDQYLKSQQEEPEFSEQINEKIQKYKNNPQFESMEEQISTEKIESFQPDNKKKQPDKNIEIYRISFHELNELQSNDELYDFQSSNESIILPFPPHTQTRHPTSNHMSVSLCRAINYELKQMNEQPYFILKTKNNEKKTIQAEGDMNDKKANFRNLKNFLIKNPKFKTYLQERKYEERLKRNNKTRTDFASFHQFIVKRLKIE
ncbi:unnamed protein product [Paramecium sonneborni]|uniref:Uncharacterized protein n=1 Tax=Paramecium sonneborni TaxID=65129 RepID=A0A8S1KMM3_9CILI|nr:unnamed protein product [Paramecium sonneborni]